MMEGSAQTQLPSLARLVSVIDIVRGTHMHNKTG